MKCKLLDVVNFNPKETIKKGCLAKKVAMDKLRPFCRDILEYEMTEFTGGTKFRNGDTIMARITPCLENGKTAKVNILDENEVGFGSTEYIVFRAKKDLLDEDYLYYLVCSPIVRDIAIKSMVGSSGRQRAQLDVIQNIEINLPTIEEQREVGALLKSLDDKIELNNKINANLQQQAFGLFEQLMNIRNDTKITVSDIAYLNPKRVLAKNQLAKCIDMSQLSTTGAFPSGWIEKPFSGGMRFTNGDTLLARITPCLENGKTAYINFLDKGEVAFGSTEYIVLAPKERIPSEYLYCLARYPEFIDYAVKNMNGSSGRQRVSAETIGKFSLPKLNNEQYDLFSKVITPMFKAMSCNSLENMKLAQLRDALLPKLMNGEIDVRDVSV